MSSIKDVADVIGDEAAGKLIECFAGEKIYIPKNQKNKDFRTEEEHRQYIFKLCKKYNMDFKAVSFTTGLSESRIRHIAAEEIKNHKRQ